MNASGTLQGPRVLPRGVLGTWETEGTVLAFVSLRAGRLCMHRNDTLAEPGVAPIHQPQKHRVREKLKSQTSRALGRKEF